MQLVNRNHFPQRREKKRGMLEDEKMENEKKEVVEQTNLINWDVFEKKETSGFLQLADKEFRIIGIKSIRPGVGKFERKQKDGSSIVEEVPQVHLVLDSIDGKVPDGDVVFPVGQKYLVPQIREYDKSRMLYQFFFKVERNGLKMDTRYTFVPIKPKGIEAAV
jgi:hypothetical protein